MIVECPLSDKEVLKLLWASKHPFVKIDQYDEIGYSLTDRGFLRAIDAGYVDWFGYWATITPKGHRAIA